jgi:RimJ/RimL family protein N-acetyltransferase
MSQPPAPRKIRLETPSFILRTVEPDDVTPRWAAWLADPANTRMMNAKPMTLSLADIRTYVSGFDHVKSHILGIFERGSNTLIGFWEVYVDWSHREYLLNILIGEHGDEPLHPRAETQRVLFAYFFGELELDTMRCAVLASNTRVVSLFAARGIVHEHASRKPDAGGGAPVEIFHYRVTKEDWAVRRAQRLAREAAQREGLRAS